MPFSFFSGAFKPRHPALDVVSGTQPPGEDGPLRTAILAISKQAATMGREAAEVRGMLEDTQKASARQAQTLNSFLTQVHDITKAQDAITDVSRNSLGAADRARAAVQVVNDGVGAIVTTLRQVSESAQTITKIALQTRLVAFNASVEAKHAGEAGRGFGVVADAVKDLAAKVEASSKEIMSRVSELDTRIDALSREITVKDSHTQNNPAAGAGGFHRALADMQNGVASIHAAAEQSREICSALNGQMASVESEITQSGRAVDDALKRSETLLKVSENLIDLMSHGGIVTEDTPYIAAVQEAAGEISVLLTEALASSAIGLADLFDEQYRPIANTNPAQFTTRFVPLADKLFPQVQERLLALSPKVVFCIAVDRNGYVAMHNKKVSQPQRGDITWDTANSRYRRIFNDRTGLASARNQRPFLLQTYRRDMGGGKFIVMKEAAAPIIVGDRHWGGLRLAFHF
jgi:methyl-accepting chemotaxis protein